MMLVLVFGLGLRAVWIVFGFVRGFGFGLGCFLVGFGSGFCLGVCLVLVIFLGLGSGFGFRGWCQSGYGSRFLAWVRVCCLGWRWG